MDRLARAAAAAVPFAAATVFALAAPAAAEDCVTVDGERVLCVTVDVVPAPDTSDGATVALVVNVDVCSSRVPRAPTCDHGSATIPLGPTGVTGASVATKTVGPTTVRIPEVCLNTTCAGPFQETIPAVDVPCLSVRVLMVVANGGEAASTTLLNGTC